jgi:hypothetical protein
LWPYAASPETKRFLKAVIFPDCGRTARERKRLLVT